MIYNWDFCKRIKCGRKDMEQCAEAVILVLNLALKSARQGLLSLEDDLESFESQFFRKALKLVLDGTDPEIVGDSLRINILAGNYSGKDLLERCIYFEGVKMIQSGRTPKEIMQILFSFFGDEYSVYIKKLYDSRYNGSPVKLFDELKNRTPLSVETSFLEKPIPGMDDKSIQTLMRKIDTRDILLACSGAGGVVFIRFLDNMSKNSRDLMIEDLAGLCNCGVAVEDIVAAQGRILKAYNELC